MLSSIIKEICNIFYFDKQGKQLAEVMFDIGEKYHIMEISMGEINDRTEKGGHRMNAEEMWRRFGREDDFDSWSFGDDADRLAQLVLEGKKTATSSAFPLYEREGEPLPRVGQYSVVLDSSQTAVCIIKTTGVYVAPFDEVCADHAFREGEGDLSLDYWRKVHRAFFSEEMNAAGLEFTEKMKVVCEEFEKVFS